MRIKCESASLPLGAWILLAILGFPSMAEEPPSIVKAAQVQQVFSIHIPRDGHLAAAVADAIKRNDIGEGAIITGIGSLQECAYHRSKSLGPDNGDEGYKVSGAIELLNLDGVIHAGKPHLHITFSNEKGAFGGHLEECRVLRGVDVVIMKYSPQTK